MGVDLKDVLIKAPAARLEGAAPAPLEPPPLEELYRLTNAALQEERRAKQQLADFASQVSSLCLSLTKMLVDQGQATDGNTVTIPKWLHSQMLGASITIGESSVGNIEVTINERGRERIHVVE